jgi:enamine deaminase RidA (YjgF/YER057c/UK114 family)
MAATQVDLLARAREIHARKAAAVTRAFWWVGAGFGDVVKLNYYVTDISRVADIRAVRDEYVDTERPPASTAVEVSRLFREELLVEVEAVAVLPA